MRNYIFIVLVAMFAIVSTGCRTSHVDVMFPKEETRIDDAKVIAYLDGDNTCYYIFGFIPFWSGNPARPNTKDYHIFEDNLSEIRNEDMLLKVAKTLDANDLKNISHTRMSSGWYTLGIVWTRVIKTKAAAVKSPKEK